MSRKRQSAASSQMSEPDEDYLNKRKRNNEAVLKSRLKSRQKEQLTAERVEELREENAELERKVDVLNRELAFLKDMFVAYAAGNKKQTKETSSGSNDLDLDLDQLFPTTSRAQQSTSKSAKPSKKVTKNVYTSKRKREK